MEQYASSLTLISRANDDLIMTAVRQIITEVGNSVQLFQHGESGATVPLTMPAD